MKLLLISMGAAGKGKTGISPLEIGINKEKFLENVKSAV